MDTFRIKTSISLLVVLMSGCCPVMYTKSPGISGRVLYADSNLPVVGVTAQLNELSFDVRIGSPVKTNTIFIAVERTDTNGCFRIRAQKGLGIYIVPMDIFPVEYQLQLINEEHVFHSYDFSHRALGDQDVYEMGDILFEQSEVPKPSVPALPLERAH
jgi:hypothetical protein